MAISKRSIFVEDRDIWRDDPFELSDEQIEAAALRWLQLLKSNTYTFDTRSKPKRRTVFFAMENKKFMLEQLERDEPAWEKKFLLALTQFLAQHRKNGQMLLMYDFRSEDLLEDFVDSVPFLKDKYGIFPNKTTMSFDSMNNVIVNGVRSSALDIIDPTNTDNACAQKLGCPRLLPAVKKIFGMLKC